jgi:hypothetical protein
LASSPSGPTDPDTVREKLSDLTSAEESLLRPSLDFFSAHPEVVGEDEFIRIVDSGADKLCPLPFLLCLRHIAVNDAAHRILVERGVVGALLWHLTSGANVDLTCEILRLLGQIGGCSGDTARLLISNGICNSFAIIVDQMVSRPVELAWDHSELFVCLVDAISSFVAATDDLSISLFIRICKEFPAVMARQPIPSLIHLYVRALLKFVTQLYIDADPAVLPHCAVVAPFVVGALSNDDVTIQELALTTLIAMTGHESDDYLDIIIDSPFFAMVPTLLDAECRPLACLVLRNFAASTNLDYVAMVLDRPVLAFLESVIDNDSFASKQKAYIVMCYLMMAMPDECEPFFTEQRCKELVDLLIESSDVGFLIAAVTVINLLLRREERRCAAALERNKVAAAFAEAGLIETLDRFETDDEGFAELIDITKINFDGALICNGLQ